MKLRGQYLIWPLWLAFLLYSFVFAPASDPNTSTIVMNILRGRFGGINWVVIALFNLMGVWPLIFMILLGIESQSQKISAWPFILGSFFLGAFLLLPYFGLRKSNPDPAPARKGIVKHLDSRGLPIVLFVISIVLVMMVIIEGDWNDYLLQFRTNGFIHVMSLDFVAFALLFPLAVKDDMLRRNWFQKTKWIGFSVVPVLGPIIYLIVAPRLIDTIPST
jgi:hypothetical protein